MEAKGGERTWEGAWATCLLLPGGQREACVSVFCDTSVTRWSLLPLEQPQRYGHTAG